VTERGRLGGESKEVGLGKPAEENITAKPADIGAETTTESKFT